MGVGTMPYMAPEQFTDFANVTVSADIYSFGIMLYEMLVGKRPFKSRKPEDFYYQHLKVTPLDPSTVMGMTGPRPDRWAHSAIRWAS